jgi:hypothetical protein
MAVANWPGDADINRYRCCHWHCPSSRAPLDLRPLTGIDSPTSKGWRVDEHQKAERPMEYPPPFVTALSPGHVKNNKSRQICIEPVSDVSG